MAGKRRRGRGRLSGFELLPPECNPLIADAAKQLQDRELTQLEIYQAFFDSCQKLMSDSRGELDFTIPSKSAFNRYSIRLALMTRRLEETREIAGSIAKRFDAEASDDLTLIAAEAVKTLVWELLTDAGESGIDAKGAQSLARALNAAVMAQNLSTVRRQKVQKEFAGQVVEAVDRVAKVRGLTQDAAEAIKAQILGIPSPVLAKVEGAK